MFTNRSAACPRAARPLVSLLITGSLVVTLSGCFGTSVDSPARAYRGPSHAELRLSLIAAPRVINVSQCKTGMSDVTTFVPLWGLAVGVLSFGIVVPQWTVYSCAAEASLR